MPETLGVAVLKLETDQTKLKSGLASAEKQTGKFGKASRLAGAAGKAAMIGVGAAAAATAFAIGKGVVQAVEFEASMREVNSLIGLSQTSFETLSSEVLAMSSDLGVASMGLSASLYDIVSAGVAAEDQLDTLRASTKLAIGGVAEMTEATDLMTTSINTFGKTGLTATEIADKWFTTVKLGKTTIAELGSAIGNIANEALQANVSLDETGAALATMTTQGLSTAMSARRLRQLLVELQKPNADLEKVIDATAKSMGLAGKEAFNLQDAVSEHGLAGVLDMLEKSMNAMGVTATQSFGSVEASSAFVALTGDSMATLTRNIEEMANSTGAAEAAFEEMNKSAKRQWETLKTKLSNVLTQVGLKILPLVGKAIQYLIPLVDRLTVFLTDKLIPGVEKFARFAGPAVQHAFWLIAAFIDNVIMPALRGLASMIALVIVPMFQLLGDIIVKYVLPLLLEAKGVFDWIGKWADEHPKLTQALLIFAGVVTGLIGGLLLLKLGIAGVMGVVSLVKLAFGGLTALLGLVLTPVGLVVLAIAAIITALVLLYLHNEAFRNFIDQKVIPTLKEWGRVIWDVVLVALEWLGRVWDDLLVIGKLLVDGFLALVRGDWAKAWELFGEAGTKTADLFKWVWEDIKTLASTIWGGVLGVWIAAWDSITSLLPAKWDELVSAWETWGGALIALVGALWAFVSAAWSAVWKTIVAVVTGDWTGVKDAWGGVWDAFLILVGAVWDFVSASWTAQWETIKLAAETAWGLVVAAWPLVWDALKVTVKAFWDTIPESWKTAWGTVKTKLSEAWELIKTLFSSWWTNDEYGFIALLAGFWLGIAALWSTAWETIKTTLSDAWSGIKTKFEEWWTTDTTGIVAVRQKQFGVASKRLGLPCGTASRRCSAPHGKASRPSGTNFGQPALPPLPRSRATYGTV